MLKSKTQKEGAIWRYHKQYKHFRILRIVSMMSAGVVLSIVGLALYFTYQSVFATIEHAETVLQVRQDISTDIINFGQYEEVQKAWKAKHDQNPLTISRDPFSLGPLPTSTAVDSTETTTSTP